MAFAKRMTILPVLLVLLIVSCSSAQAPAVPVYRDGGVSAAPPGPRAVVAYQSKYGSTRQYAEWISEELSCDLFDLGKDARPDYSRYEVIIFGGYFRMGGIPVASVIKDNWRNIRGKRVILFTASGTPPGHPGIRKAYGRSLPDEIGREIRHFPLRGRLLGKDVGFFDSILVSIGRMVEKDEALRAFMSGDFDGVRRENIRPLIDYVREIGKQPVVDNGK